MSLFDRLRRKRGKSEPAAHPPDFDDFTAEVWARVRPFTMTSPERIAAAVEASRHVARHGIPGAIVECGVWKGGATMAMLLTLLERGISDRDVFLYDTFAGMVEPDEMDVSLSGDSARSEFEKLKISEAASEWCHSPLEEVRANLSSTGYPDERCTLVKGKVEDTIPATIPESIALLRLDTDWYESTRHELEHLYPRLVPGGVLIIDDYGHWQGARRAVDEYLEKHRIPLLLSRIDYTCRMAVKPA